MERLPNWLTWARLVAVPIVMVLLYVDDGREGTARGWATALFGIAAATDFLDGYLARRWHVVSSFGKLADPIADKALVLGTLLMLIVVDGMPWWPFAVLLLRLGRDPAMGSSVMITAMTDSGGFFIFLGLATLFLM